MLGALYAAKHAQEFFTAGRWTRLQWSDYESSDVAAEL